MEFKEFESELTLLLQNNYFDQVSIVLNTRYGKDNVKKTFKKYFCYTNNEAMKMFSKELKKQVAKLSYKNIDYVSNLGQALEQIKYNCIMEYVNIPPLNYYKLQSLKAWQVFQVASYLEKEKNNKKLV